MTEQKILNSKKGRNPNPQRKQHYHITQSKAVRDIMINQLVLKI